MIKLNKAVFPVAGLGTRFLPATKASPKEMLPIVDKPLIQYAVEEALKAGFTELIFVTSSSKRAIEDHFDSSKYLEHELIRREKSELLKTVQNIVPSHVSLIYLRQYQPLGLGHAINCAKSVIGTEHFAVLLADDLIENEDSCLTEMLKSEVFSNTDEAACIAVEEVKPEDCQHYGIVDLSTKGLIQAMIEKPKPGMQASNLAAVGRYILPPTIFGLLSNIPYRFGELQLTDAINAYIRQGGLAQPYCLQGKRYDCGKKIDYMMANVRYALRHPEIGKEFRNKLEQLIYNEINIH